MKTLFILNSERNSNQKEIEPQLFYLSKKAMRSCSVSNFSRCDIFINNYLIYDNKFK